MPPFPSPPPPSPSPSPSLLPLLPLPPWWKKVVLNIYNQRDPLVRAYLNGPAARSTSLPDRLVGALRSQCLVLADRAMAAGVGEPAGRGEGGGGGAGGGTERRGWGDGVAVPGAGGALGAGGGATAAARDPTICLDSIAGLQDQVQ